MAFILGMARRMDGWGSIILSSCCYWLWPWSIDKLRWGIVSRYPFLPFHSREGERDDMNFMISGLAACFCFCFCAGWRNGWMGWTGMHLFGLLAGWRLVIVVVIALGKLRSGIIVTFTIISYSVQV